MTWTYGWTQAMRSIGWFHLAATLSIDITEDPGICEAARIGFGIFWAHFLLRMA